MKVFESNCTFDYSWEEVSTANWRKYCPWNDKSTHVVAVDTLSRIVDPATGIVKLPPPESLQKFFVFTFLVANRTLDNVFTVGSEMGYPIPRRCLDITRL